MLGFKILLTGLSFMFISVICYRVIVFNEYKKQNQSFKNNLFIKITVLIMFYGGAFAVVIGNFMQIWQ